VKTIGWLAVGLACALAGACAEPADPSLRAAAPEQRDALLLQAIRDAGYLCEEIVDVTMPVEIATGWRVLCKDMLVYLASLDASNAVHIEPIAYGDPATPVIGRSPDATVETVRPDP
jgi:hypothetical protein